MRGNVHINFGFSYAFCYRVRSKYAADRQTDGRARSIIRLSERITLQLSN